MLTPNDRNLIESQIIHAILSSKIFFLKVYDFNPNVDDLFSNPHNRKIYSAIIEYYVEKDYPTSQEVFNQMILNNFPDETKQHFTKSIPSAEPITDFKLIPRLLEDSIERETRNQIALIDKKNLSGLTYAEAIREKTDEIILSKFESYKRDTRNNEERVYDLLDDIHKIREGKHTDYINTGFKKLDEAIIGIPKGHLTTIAARPGMGKTSFMLQLKRNFCDRGYKPLIISIEMTSNQLMIKDLSALTEIDSKKIESGNLSDEETQRLDEKANIICKENYFIEDDGIQTIEKIKSTIRRHLVKNSIDAVFIDYLTLMRTPHKKDRYDLVIGEITNSLREFAKDTGLPIVILSQLNRSCESRVDKRPQLSDLRESGSIEQDSKTALFLYRPAYYGIDPFAKGNGYLLSNGNKLSANEYLEVIIAKCRNGSVGIVPVCYRQHLHKFESVSYSSETSRHADVPVDNWYERETPI